jgi:hypothetical protein
MQQGKRVKKQKEKFMEQNREKYVHDVFYIVHEDKVKGMSVRQASEALEVSERTIFRMLEDGRLKGKRAYLPDGKYVWDISTLSVARLLVREEVEHEVGLEMKTKKKTKRQGGKY